MKKLLMFCFVLLAMVALFLNSGWAEEKTFKLAGQTWGYIDENCNYLLFGTNEKYLNLDDLPYWGNQSEEDFRACAKTLEEAKRKLKSSNYWEDLEYLHLLKIEEIPLEKVKRYIWKIKE